MQGQAIEAETGLDSTQVEIAVNALESAGLVDAAYFGGGVQHVKRVSGDARRAVQSWPTPETGVDRLIAALEDIADNSEDEDQRTRARKALDALTGAGKQIAVSVTSAVITGQIT